VTFGSGLVAIYLSLGCSHKKPPAILKGEIPEGLGVKFVLN